jgi:hypothetical protein
VAEYAHQAAQKKELINPTIPENLIKIDKAAKIHIGSRAYPKTLITL